MYTAHARASGVHLAIETQIGAGTRRDPPFRPQVRTPGSGRGLEIGAFSITVDSVTASSGLEIKADPGIPFVYAGFGALMVTTALSVVPHTQVSGFWHTDTNKNCTDCASRAQCRDHCARAHHPLLQIYALVKHDDEEGREEAAFGGGRDGGGGGTPAAHAGNTQMTLLVGGKCNRDKIGFSRAFEEMLAQMASRLSDDVPH